MELPIAIVAANLPIFGRAKPAAAVRRKGEQGAGVVMAFTTAEQICLPMASQDTGARAIAHPAALRYPMRHLVGTDARENLLRWGTDRSAARPEQLPRR